MEQALDLYRKNYRPSEINPKPIATIRVWALAADTEEEALRQFKTRESSMIDRKQGIRLPLMPPEEAERPYSPAMSIAVLQPPDGCKRWLGSCRNLTQRMRTPLRVGAEAIVAEDRNTETSSRRLRHDGSKEAVPGTPATVSIAQAERSVGIRHDAHAVTRSDGWWIRSRDSNQLKHLLQARFVQ